MTRGRLWPAVIGTWLFASAILCLVSVTAIAGLRLPDPDDAMRLLEVRDWLAGQSWWDVGQHRLNGGVFPMHWSRIVDLPLALVLSVVGAFASPGFADRLAVTIVPLATLLAVMAGIAALTDRLAGREQAKLALLLTPLSIPLVFQLRPTRIDHHGWQVALAVGAMLALIGPATARRGALAGAALATLVTISLEGLPIAAMITGVGALSWAIYPQRRRWLLALLGTFSGLAAVLHIATRGPNALAASCDAMSPAWLIALAVAAGTAAIAVATAPSTSLRRVAALLPCGALAAAVLLLFAPDCARGPFATLDPLVRKLWYQQVAEGLPIWDQALDWGVITAALPIVGIVGAFMALRVSPLERRLDWQLLLAVLVPMFALSCLVNRTGATANALALPGAAALLLIMLERARALPAAPVRALATAGAILVASPGLIAAATLTHVGADSPAVAVAGAARRPPCERFDQVRALAQLPAGTVFLPLDVSPDLLATTRHKAVAAGYHRNSAAMRRVLAAFVGTPAEAERLVRASGADYVAGCPDLNETRLYDATSPHGFWAQLEAGQRFDWLQPVAIKGSPVLAWRVLPADSATNRAE